MVSRKPKLTPLRLSRIAGALGLALAVPFWGTGSLSAQAGPQHSGSAGGVAQAQLVNISAKTSSATDLSQVELQMWQMVNNDRSSSATAEETKGRAHPLEWDSRLAAVARAHSEEMAANGYFSHRGIDGSSPMVRVSNAGIRWRAEGENIAKAYGATQAEAMFMDEPKFQPNHRGNILDPNYNRVGIGIAKAADGSLYVTQEFAQIP